MKKICLILLFVLPGVFIIAQRAGDLKIDFGNNGIVMERWDDAFAVLYDAAGLSDGNIIAAGRIYEVGADTVQKLFIHKIDKNGNLLPFGNTIRGFVYQLEDWSTLSDLFVGTDNTFLITGYYKKEGISIPYIMKLLPDGNLDVTFGTNGIVLGDTIPLFLNAIETFQLDGPAITLLGGYGVDEKLPMILAIDDDGKLIPSFGTGGTCRLHDRPCIINCLDVNTENRYLYAGGYFLQGDTVMVAKIGLPDGQLCSDFGEGGVFYYSTGEPISTGEIIYEKDNNTLTLFGSYKVGDDDWDVFTLRINASDASPEASFGTDGTSAIRLAGSIDDNCLAVKQSDGKYCIAARTNSYGNADFLTVRMNHDGSMDTAFGTDGIVINALESEEYFFDCWLSPEEDILYAAGNYSMGDTTGAIIVAYHTGYKTEQVVNTVEKQINSVHLYPNPFKENVTITTGQSGSHHIQVLDMTGKVIMTKNFCGDNCNLNLEGLQSSVYLIKLLLPDTQVMTYKIIKQ